MKIVITNPSGLQEKHIQELKQLGEVEVFDNTNSDNCAERLKGADIAVIDCFLTPVTRELLIKSPSLKFFSINSTGFDKVDVEAVRDAGVLFSNVPGFSTESVAELAIGLMFAVNRKITLADKDFRNGLYEVDPNTQESKKYQNFNLRGRMMGVVGLGAIGTRIAELGNGIGMNVIGYNRTNKNLPSVKQVSLNELIPESDVIILSLALNAQTKGIITKEHIESMKKSAIFVNISRHDLVDNQTRKNSLNNNMIAGAGLDVVDKDFLEVKNTVITPHIGWLSHDSYENMGRIISENIKAFVNGDPINQVV